MNITLKLTGCLVLLTACSHASALTPLRLPPEVTTFIEERKICDHFRGEPFEGDSPEQVERREYLLDSFDIYCAGTDKRLAALKRRYKDNPAVMRRLSEFEERVE
ncbi:hypothetical protein FUT88_12745 [Ralstonia sp. TCR112]|uniref:hypothetical protein n=1 Tax=unclassified Ralstonia TaxID=209769 RepID=UPI0011BD8AC8|nr:hypothetical protein [Ralstonia sp. TCR112]TXD59424.1 hypothetical protein FUT88_12745 [Ralstonia sp. TCR112]